jgi:hypothetical protein
MALRRSFRYSLHNRSPVPPLRFVSSNIENYCPSYVQVEDRHHANYLWKEEVNHPVRLKSEDEVSLEILSSQKGKNHFFIEEDNESISITFLGFK